MMEIEIKPVDLVMASSPGRDQFDRKYPIKIELKDGKVIYGHLKSFQRKSENEYLDIIFNVIQNIEDWKTNRINERGQNKIVIDYNEISRLWIIKSY